MRCMITAPWAVVCTYSRWLAEKGVQSIVLHSNGVNSVHCIVCCVCPGSISPLLVCSVLHIGCVVYHVLAPLELRVAEAGL
jgi:hypothetical protein